MLYRMRAAVFLDRDNTLIHNDGDLGDPDHVRLIQGAASAIASLRGLNYHIIVVTNQGGVARGVMTEEDVDLVNQRINEKVLENSEASIDRFYYCPFHPEGTIEDYRKEHPWRKPAPGMIQQAARDMNLDLARSWMVGDQIRDIQSGKAAGVRTILLTDHVGSTAPLKQREQAAAAFSAQAGQEGQGPDGQVIPDFVARNLVEAVRLIAQQRKPDLVEEAKAAAARRIDLRGSRQATAERADISTDTPPDAPADSPADVPVEAPADAPATKQVDQTPAAPISPPAENRAQDQVRAQDQDQDKSATPSQNAIDETESKSATRSQDDEVAASTAKGSAADSGGTELADSGDRADSQGDEKPESHQAQQQTSKDASQEAPKAKSSGIQMLAAVLQLVAVICLIAGYYLDGANILIFIKWLGAAVAAEMIVVSLLILRR